VGKERRDSERIELLGSVHGAVLVVQAAEIRQISRGGMLVETRFALRVDSLHDFRLELSDLSLVLKGRVVHSHIHEVDQDIVLYHSGIEFIEPSETVQAAIVDFIEALKVQRGRI
jgi:PilZ domain